MLLAVVPVLLRAGSAPTGGVLFLTVGSWGIRCVPLMGAAVLVSSFVGFLKYGSRADLPAYGLWVLTFVSVAILGIVMFEAFSLPCQWSGSLQLPGVVLITCAAGTLAGAAVAGMRRYRCRFRVVRR